MNVEVVLRFVGVPEMMPVDLAMAKIDWRSFDGSNTKWLPVVDMADGAAIGAEAIAYRDSIS